MDNPTQELRRLVTVGEAQRALSIGHTTLYRLINEGKLKAVKIGAGTRISLESLEALAEGGTDAKAA